VITPESPLGSQLLGKKQGDTCQLEISGRSENYKISAVS
jgi:transcription elongation GreA/GreB family factor